MIQLRESLWQQRQNLIGQISKRRLACDQFTIVSNNCWGAEAYRELGLQYQTPFVGLAVFAPCYLKLVQDLPTYMGQALRFTKESRYREVNEAWVKNPDKIYPIGILGEDIEIHFIHYANSTEAYEKWSRRSARVNWLDQEKLFFKLCDHDYCTPELIKKFSGLALKHKVCFTSQDYSNLESIVWIRESHNIEHVMDGYSLFFRCKRYFDFIDWLNGGRGEINLQFSILRSLKLS
jgi:uncharacterized protein (DUF1919 family)